MKVWGNGADRFLVHAHMQALLKQATLKINEKATLPGNVEGIDQCSLPFPRCGCVTAPMYKLELTVSDYNEILSSEPSRKVRIVFQ